MEKLDFTQYSKALVIFVHKESIFFTLNQLYEDKVSDVLLLILGEQTYHEKEMKRINARLVDMKSMALFIRGYNDDENNFNGETIKFSNCQLIKDGTIVSVKTHNILCIGGYTPFNLNFLHHFVALNGIDIESGMVSHDNAIINELEKKKHHIDVLLTVSTTKILREKNWAVNRWSCSNEVLKSALEKDYTYFDNILNSLNKNKELKYYIGASHNNEELKDDSQNYQVIEIAYNRKLDLV